MTPGSAIVLTVNLDPCLYTCEGACDVHSTIYVQFCIFVVYMHTCVCVCVCVSLCFVVSMYVCVLNYRLPEVRCVWYFPPSLAGILGSCQQHYTSPKSPGENWIPSDARGSGTNLGGEHQRRVLVYDVPQGQNSE